jgi:lipopolysaccharide biosynthesis regulator YciM
MVGGLFAWLLLPLGMILGWALRRSRDDGTGAGRAELTGGNSGLDQEQAIAALARAVDADPAAELQLALGGLLRRRGEIDRAIALHEAVLAHPALAPQLQDAARLELAQDYLKAGLLDRAETMAIALSDSSQLPIPALELLLDLYEQSRDWPHAIETARRLQGAKGQSNALRIAHYWCELAETAKAKKDLDGAAAHVAKAQAEDRDSVRAAMLEAAIAESRGDWKAALEAYWRAMQRNGRFFPEVAAQVERCCREAGDTAGYGKFLDEALSALTDLAAPALAKARWMQAQGQPVRGFLAEPLARKPTREGLLVWIEGGPAEEPSPLRPLAETLKKSIQMRPKYACAHCGVAPSVLFWQCPGCKRWGSIAPAEEKL